MKSTCLLFPLLLWMGSCTPQTSPNALYRALNDPAGLDRVIRENEALKPQISNEFIRKEYEKKKG